MKVSIITTCYNRASTVRGAIESVLSQDYSDIEYIVVDGASSDNSMNIINEFKDKIALIVSEKDSGMYEAINKGIRLATGDIVGLVHSDDYLYDNHVITEIERVFEETGADFVYGDGLFVDSCDGLKPIRKWIGGNFHRWKLACGWLPLHPTCYIRRDVMMREGLYDESYKIAADSDLLYRYLFKDNLKVVYIKKMMIIMRMGGLSTDKEKRKQMFWEDVRMYRSHGRWGIPTKIMKMCWKIPQYIEARIMASF